MKVRSIGRASLSLLLSLTLLTGCSSASSGGDSSSAVRLDPAHPTAITVWHYYNGAQQEAFNRLVDEFNETAGKEQGIAVESFGQGNVSDLESSVLDAVNHKVGAGEIPSIFAAYADTAYAVDKLGLAVDLTPYLGEKEQARFIDSYIEEGRFSADSGLKIFPIAKSTEIFMLNKTDWDRFAAATGAQLDALETIEGLTKTAQTYYEWTDSLTPVPYDGHAFFGRDAMANYFIIGSKQLGAEIFSVENGKATLNFEREIAKKLWDHYYTPFVHGYFSASGRFRSDDIKTGHLISFVGSSSGATFFPKEVILSDSQRYPIDMLALPCPQFEGGEKVAVQQGAGMVVTKTDEQQILASVEFLKWFTQDERNIQFSVSSGYLPVTKAANDIDKIHADLSDSKRIAPILSVSIDTVKNNTLYTTRAFANGTKARAILEHSLSDQAAADRQTVLTELAAGKTLAQATAVFDSEENFDAWYQDITERLKLLMK